ncbi:MAG: ATP-binding protein [Boseongicola sp.]
MERPVVQLIDRRTRDGDLVTLALNITEQTIREDQLREARERAEAANRAKSAFLANMSHEIRTPMNGVVAMAEMLAETQLDEEQRAYAETIRSSGEALLVIINDVLDYSKIEADQISFKSLPFDLERCIHDIVTLLRPGAQDKDLQIAVDYDLFMPTSYLGDVGRIRQVLTNLVGNAIKFTEAGHILIRVVGLPGESGLEYRVHITVEDTGIGIPEDELDSIFQEFQQVENEQDRAHDGTGLGLAITRRLVKAMGGDVWVDSREGTGSGFGFFLPLEAVGDVEPEDITAPGWMDRAIVLDDDGMNQTVLLKQLGLMGLKTSTVERVEDIATARPSQRDIVLLGHGAADGDTFDAARAIREQYTPAGVFLLVSGPTKVPHGGMAFDRLLQRPVLRGALMECLVSLDPPDFDETAKESMVDGPTVSKEIAAAGGHEDASRDEQQHEERVGTEEITASEMLEKSSALEDNHIRLPTNSQDNRRQMRVLAAEDNRTNRFVFKKLLKDLDIDLVFAMNGLEAIEMFSDIRPDIFFTDISMPKMDGKEATRRIRLMESENNLPPCPIVAITAHAMDGDVDEILAAGVDHYLTKPLKKQNLIAHILDAMPALPVPDDEVGEAQDDTEQLQATAAE